MRARILIVDDNAMNLKLARLLVLAEGHDADVADGAEQALAVLGRQRPNLVLMDLQMPGIDGLELTRRLKLDPATRDIPVIALTAAAMSHDRDAALAAGCEGFITKPLDTRTFAQVIDPFLPVRSEAA